MFSLCSVPLRKHKYATGNRIASRVAGLAALLLGSFLASSALAQLPSPQPPNPWWQEDFSNTATTPISLALYTSVGGLTYSADADWLPGFGACNGWILNSTSTSPPDGGCSSSGGRLVNSTGTVTATTPNAWTYLQGMAYELGVAQKAADPTSTIVPANNNVLAFMTNGGKNQNNHIQFETAPNAITLTAGRYYIASAWFATVHCVSDGIGASPAVTWYDASETFSLLIPGSPPTVIPLGATGLNPCTASPPPGVQPYYDDANAGRVHVAQLQSSAILIDSTTTTVGLRLSNGTVNYPGNDSAFDAPALMDATPQLYKSFNPNMGISSDYTIIPGGTATLTFVVINTTDYQAKPGWSFTDTLPTGVTVANPVVKNTTCDSGTVTATAGGSTVEATGNLLAGATNATCTITVEVTSSILGTYPNGPSNVTAIGVDEHNTATLTSYLNVANLAFTKNATVTDSAGNLLPGILEVGDKITYTFSLENDTGDDLTAINIDELNFSGSNGPLDTSVCSTQFAVPLAPGDTTSCDVVYTITQDDVDAGSVYNQALAIATTNMGQEESPAADATTPVYTPALTLTKTANVHSFTAGQTITFSFLITNTGNYALDNITVDDTTFTGSGTLSAVTCPTLPAAGLVVHDSITCTADYTVTAADVAAGSIDNTATASGTVLGVPPAAARLVTSHATSTSSPSSVHLSLRAAPSSIPALDARALALLALLLGGLAWSARRKMA
ncbi:MAG: DUF11 domain-containing protein [Burkholderiales bacterium]|jgi:hypothetical protein|nr:DUF11 domain-containing protein [Burkholderiales bacterium]